MCSSSLCCSIASLILTLNGLILPSLTRRRAVEKYNRLLHLPANPPPAVAPIKASVPAPAHPLPSHHPLQAIPTAVEGR